MQDVVSVVVPTFNRAALLPRAIASLRQQTHTEWELVVVDDASQDNTPEIMASLVDSRVRYLRHEANRGPSGARNTGLRAATGKYVAFLDSDDEWASDKLERQLRLLQSLERDGYGLLTCGLEIISPSSATSQVRGPDAEVTLASLLLQTGVIWDTVTCFALRSHAARVEFDESLPAYEDFDFVARMAKVCRVWCSSDVLVKSYYNNPGPRASHRILEGRLKVLEKYRQELSELPAAHSHHHVRIALKYFHQGDVRSARKHLWSAARIYPTRPQHWMWWMSTALGTRGLWLALRVFKHPTTR